MDSYAVCISSIRDYRLSWWLSGKEPAHQCRKHKFDPWVWKSPGERNGNALQFSCLGNPMDRGPCQAIVRGVAKESDTINQLNSNNIRDYHTFNDLTQMYYFTVFIGQEYRHKLARSTAQGLPTLKSKCCPGL